MVLLIALVDPVIQNGFLYLLFKYLYTMEFVNATCYDAMGFFVFAYLVVTIISAIGIGLSFTARHNAKSLKWF